MGLLELFILAVGLSMDAFAVSVCKGLAMPKITLRRTLIVGAWFGGFQALMPAVGYVLGVQFRDKITAVDHWIAFLLLGVIGANMIKEALSGGLAFRRGADPGTFVVTTGKDTAARLQTTLDPADDWAWHTYALTYDSAQETSLTLYVDGEQVATGVPSGTVIDAPFQWGTRHGNPMAGEAKGNGAIDAMGVWKRVLTQTEIQALVADWYTETTVAVSFTALPEGYMPPPRSCLAA